MKISGAAGTVTNSGSIAGVYIGNGTVINGGIGIGHASISLGVTIGNGLGAVTNFGSISSAGSAPFDNFYGVYLKQGGSVKNGQTDFTSASIAGLTRGVDIAGARGIVTNFGRIAGATDNDLGSIGVSLSDGGIVTNGAASSTAASISGYEQGVQIAHGPGALMNFGRIAASGSAGVIPSSGASSVRWRLGQ